MVLQQTEEKPREIIALFSLPGNVLDLMKVKSQTSILQSQLPPTSQEQNN